MTKFKVDIAFVLFFNTVTGSWILEHVCNTQVTFGAVCVQIEQRILAFIQRKQMEVDENNVREFCRIIDLSKGITDQFHVHTCIYIYISYLIFIYLNI